MRLRSRTYFLFLVALLAATYGAGQLWNLATELRGGAASPADIVAITLGAVVLAVSAIVLGRILYVIGNKSRSAQAGPEGQNND